MNRRDGEDFVMERLDRAFSSVDWVNAYASFLEIFLLFDQTMVLFC